VIIGGWRGPGWRITDADPGQAGPGLDPVRHRPAPLPVDPADAALAVSELYTKRCHARPAGGRVLTGYCLWSTGTQIVVCDGGPGTPRAPPARTWAKAAGAFRSSTRSPPAGAASACPGPGGVVRPRPATAHPGRRRLGLAALCPVRRPLVDSTRRNPARRPALADIR
jgi:hypothetical protein